jgi:hypothetical protein
MSLPLQPHQQRVVNEHNELTERIDKLGMFLKTDQFGALESEEKRLLLEQHYYMRHYALTLEMRITRWRSAQA